MRERPGLRAAVIAWVASLAAATSYLAANNWFGAGDLYAMAIWSLPLALLATTIVRLLRSRLGRWPIPVVYLVAVAGGAGIGVLTTLVCGLLLGPWIGAFSFPVLFAWSFGGVIALLATVWLERRRTWPVALVLALLAAAILARANAYAHAPPPRIRIFVKANATPDEVQRIWTEVIGQPHPSGEGNEMLEGLSGAAASGRDGPNSILTVSFRKSTSRERRDSIVALIRRSPLVDRVEAVSPNDTTGVRVSVEY